MRSRPKSPLIPCGLVSESELVEGPQGRAFRARRFHFIRLEGIASLAQIRDSFVDCEAFLKRWDFPYFKYDFTGCFGTSLNRSLY